MFVEEQDLSIIKGVEGYRSKYSVPECTEYLSVDLSSEKLEYGWLFWWPEIYQPILYDILLYHDYKPTSHQKEIAEKIASVLKATASNREGWFWCESLVQFWAARVDDRGHLCLMTSDQPFCLRDLYKGCFWYRKLCMNHCYYVEGAKEGQLGPVGRVYQNKHPESSPDLRLYSTTEFPLRDYAARCGLRSYLALPVFDLLKNECYGVLEVLSFSTMMTDQFLALDRGLQEGGLRSTHTNFFPISEFDVEPMPPKYKKQPESEMSRMLELAIKAVPQLHLVQVWVPCKQCANMNNNLSCLERAIFITADSEILSSCKHLDFDMFQYLQACEFHNLQMGKGIARAITSTDSKSCFCGNLCDLSISENPLAHYAQQVRLSLCFAVSLESVHNSNDLYVVEFFLKSTSREDACGDSFLHLILRIMEVELKSYKFSLEGQLGEELVVELGKPNAIQYGSSEYKQGMKHDYSEELCMFMSMERYWEIYSESSFQKYLEMADLCFVRLSKNDKFGWLFWSLSREELFENDVNGNSSLVLDPIRKKIELSINKIASELLPGSYRLVQFWAPKMEDDGCYLTTLDQPFALGCLHKGLASFRKKCMKHRYSVNEGAKEEELGPPGRAFRNGHPEVTPDLRLYSTREFSLRNHAAQCHLRKYFALPVFDLDQYKCVGVLEFVQFSDYISIEHIEKALEATNMSSTHFRFNPSFQAGRALSNIAECRKLALTEVKEALQVIAGIPQLYKAEVRVPYDDSNVSCMELALSTENLDFDDLPMDKIHVRTRKGIAKMVLASENKSCFCRNSCDFNITEQPLVHYEQRERLDVCFAICLQSSHTGTLLYVLEFFLNQGPATYGYLVSFLKFLLPKMKQKLKSFKVASGKQLGEELVIEVIEFSEANKLTLSELDQLDIFPLKFKVVQYGQKEHQHAKDKQMQYVCDDMDSVASVAQAKQCNPGASSSKKEDVAKRKTGLHLKLEDLKPHFGKRLKDVAEELGVGRSTIKRACRHYGVHRWPCNEKHKNNPSLFETVTANEVAPDSQQDMSQAHIASTQHVQPDAETVIIKVKYEDDTIKFELCVSSGMEKLVEEVATRLNLKKGGFKLKYMDEDDDEISLACDADLHLCLKSLKIGKTCIQLFVRLIHE